ncbi:MAG TPA: cytochrome c [Miltoncostaeaceae bacterium]|nr:cytochrome c [Miltoncostaeaceae bacterium]
MRVSRGAVAALAVAGLLGVAAGCGGDDDSADQPPTTEAPTTTEAPATTAPPATTTAPATTAGGGGDAAAVEEGQIFFASTCTSCHLDNGTAGGGVGPQLAGAGLTEDQIREQVINGGGAMPPGLAQGQDLDNVTAYVLSLQ